MKHEIAGSIEQCKDTALIALLVLVTLYKFKNIFNQLFIFNGYSHIMSKEHLKFQLITINMTQNDYYLMEDKIIFNIIPLLVSEIKTEKFIDVLFQR